MVTEFLITFPGVALGCGCLMKSKVMSPGTPLAKIVIWMSIMAGKLTATWGCIREYGLDAWIIEQEERKRVGFCYDS